MRSFLIFLCCFVLGTTPVSAGKINDLKIYKNGPETRFVLEIDAAVPYRVFALNNPPRIVIDLPRQEFRAPMNKGDRNGIIKAYRQSVFQKDTSRIVLDLNRPARVTSHQRLTPQKGKGWRYLFDLQAIDPMAFQKEINLVKTGGGAPSDAVGHTAETKLSTNVLTVPDRLKDPAERAAAEIAPAVTPTQIAPSAVKLPLIVVDAGHGGIDPGARAVNGMDEKHITLAVAQKLRRVLEGTGRYRVKLTRDKDFYIKLPDRVKIARAAGADLFISLHADTIGRSVVRGASVYTLSDKASDTETAKLAERENAVDTLVNVNVGDVDEDVANILIDLVTRDTMNQSKTLAETVVRTFRSNKLSLLPERPHRSAGFAVLKAPDIPSILIEMGYLSNREEAQNLSNDAHREKIARAVADTVDRFFSSTRLAAE